MKLAPPILYTAPGFKNIANFLPPNFLFLCAKIASETATRLSPHTKRFVTPIHQIIGNRCDERKRNEIVLRYLLYRNYLNYLNRSWAHEAVRSRVAVKIIGQEHLDRALAERRGAILVSGHAYGLNRLVAPILTRQQYVMIRGGTHPSATAQKLAGTGEKAKWTYIEYGTDPWQRVRALKQITRALNGNAILHVLVLGHPGTAPDRTVRLFDQPFYLDETTLQLVSELERPVLPCFALCSPEGELEIRIHAPANDGHERAVQHFISMYEYYLSEFPEFVRFWKQLRNKKDFL